MAAHDLNGALHALGTYLELASAAADAAQLGERLEMARECLARCRQISATLQSFDQLGGPTSSFDLRPVCSDAAARHAAGLQLPPDPLRVHTDRAALEATLDALLHRARRAASGHIALTLAVAEGGATLVIEDDGPAPALGGRDRVDPFAADAPSGLGRGLEMLLTRAFLEGAGASLHISRSALGGGRVALDLPGAP